MGSFFGLRISAGGRHNEGQRHATQFGAQEGRFLLGLVRRGPVLAHGLGLIGLVPERPEEQARPGQARKSGLADGPLRDAGEGKPDVAQRRHRGHLRAELGQGELLQSRHRYLMGSHHSLGGITDPG